jgi:thiamine phosphate synthase YjbQ (UPF0047 family)
MASSTTEVTLELTPSTRFDLINVADRVDNRVSNLLSDYPRALYCSYHTTAGYMDERICAELNYSPSSLQQFIKTFQELFPPNADYHHDQLHLRTELSELQRKREPLNADSHLTFIGSGLENCVSYRNHPEKPVFFIDLDGLGGKSGRRHRQTTVIGYSEEQTVHRTQLTIPVSDHPIDSVNIASPHLGVFDQLQDLIDHHNIEKGRIDISLNAQEENAALTVNEYETLLMQYDIPEVLRNPLRFMKEKGKSVLKNPRAVPHRALDYAKYDLVRVMNGLLDKFGMNESVIERILDKFMSVPAARYLRMKRSVTLLVSDKDHSGHGTIVQGTYQSPILVQWDRPSDRQRTVDITLSKFV